MININDKAEMVKVISDDDIKLFAQVSGDLNPLHLDDAYAAETIFGKRIAHGMLSASFISNVIGNQLPGEGTIYMHQSLEFKRPVYIGDIITTIVEVSNINYESGKIELITKCTNQDSVEVICGKAVVKNKKAVKLYDIQ